MNLKDIKARLANIDPLLVDVLTAVGLTALVCLQVWLLQMTRPAFIRFPGPEQSVDYGILPYLVTAAVFMPLALRRTLPWLALVLSTIATIFYSVNMFPTAFTVMGPMVAIYSVAACSKGRRSTLFVLLAIGLAFAVPAFVFSNVARVVETTGLFMLLATSAFLGDTTRSRRAYTEEVEQRAAEAERTREEEALRRVDEERIRIAREVHDIVAHSLSIVAVQASAASTLIDKEPERARESIANIRATSREALTELRSMLDVLRTGENEAPLRPAADLTQLESLARPIREAGYDVRLDLNGTRLETVPAFASVSAYRIIQEALTNAVRHSNGTAATVSVRLHSNRFTIEVTDNGVAAPNEMPVKREGHGLEGMQERVVALGGKFDAGPCEDGGFRVYASIPLSRSSQ